MPLSTRRIEIATGCSALVAPSVHSLTDLIEVCSGGFSEPQLWLNYLAFLVIPFATIGLYACQRPKIGLLGLVGAVLYGMSFVYFSHSTLYAIQEGVQDYSVLWKRLGATYTIHGVLMVLGGLAFGAASLRARILPAWACGLFLTGLVVNAVLAIAGAPELLQTVGSHLRNLGLAGMGLFLILGGV